MFAPNFDPKKLNEALAKCQASLFTFDFSEDMLRIKEAHLLKSQTVAAQVTKRAMDRLLAQVRQE